MRLGGSPGAVAGKGSAASDAATSLRPLFPTRGSAASPTLRGCFGPAARAGHARATVSRGRAADEAGDR